MSLLTAPARSAQELLKLEWRLAANGDGEAVLTNLGAAPLTAYILQVLREPCNPIQANRQLFIGYDSSTSPDGNVIEPLASRIQNLGASHCNKDGVHSPARAEFKAALFANGTTYGDKQWVETLFHHRKVEMRRIERVIGVLQSGVVKKYTRQECVALLEKAEASLKDPEDNSRQVEFPGVDPFEMAIHQLKNDQTAPLKDQAEGLVNILKAMSEKLGHAQSSHTRGPLLHHRPDC